MRKSLLLVAVFIFMMVGCSKEAPAPEQTAKAAPAKEEAAKTKPKSNPLEKWKPDFDPSGAEYVLKVGSVAHPAIVGVSSAYRIRDELWRRSGGRIFYDFYPLGQLGGEVEMLNQLAMGNIQGMLCSSVAVTNIAPRMGVVNLPFLVNTFEKLDKFIANPELFGPFLAAPHEKGIMGVDVTGYGGYGWATIGPVQTLETAKTQKFRIAEAAVNKSLYAKWGLNAVVMPWPDVPMALKQQVIDGLDHTPVVCSLSRKFDVAKNYTTINYAQGLYIHLLNKEWFDTLPADLQKVVTEVTNEVCNETRKLTEAEENREIERAKAELGVAFHSLSEEEMTKLRTMGKDVHEEWSEQIGPDYLNTVQKAMGYGE